MAAQQRQQPQPQRTFEQFLLVTVAHGRNGTIPYTYPPASPNDAVMDRLPDKDIIALCFPDLEELRKIRALDFKAPAPAPAPAATLGIGTVVNQLGVHVSGGMPAAPPTLAATPSSPSSTVSSASGSYIAAAANSTSNITTSSLSSSGKGGFRAEFSTIALPGADGGEGGGSDRLFLITYRCLPSGFGMRYDVGKRFPECLCFVTRHQQAVPVFQQALQQIHALRLVYAPIERIEAFLHGLYDRPRLPVPGETMALKLPLDAAGGAAAAPHGATRTYRFVWPADGEAPTGDHALASLYLFQQLKPRGLLLLLSALLTERRVCLVGGEGDKLSGCAHAALALLYPFAWQHAFVPVLPPALLPALVGGQQQDSRPVFFGLRREHLPLLGPLCGELICVDVDSGEVSWTHEGPCPLPDIYVLPNTSQVVQAAQRLGGAEAAKAAEKLDKAFSKGVAFLQRYTGQQLPSSRQADEPKPDAANMLAWELSLLAQSRASTPVVWRGGGGGRGWQVGGKGEKGLLNDEQQLRDALLVFFVNIAGDASTYLRPVGGGGGGGGGARLQLDRDLYMGSRGMLGDGPALTALLLELVQTRAFAVLAEARTEREARFLTAASPRAAAAAGLVGASEAAGPFLRCAEALRARGETFAVKNVQRVLKAQSQQQAQAAQAAAVAAGGGMLAGPEAGEAGGVGVVGDPTAVGRWTVFHDTALQLTSNSANATADAQRALLSLVEDAHNAALLPSILRAVWSRLGDCRGLKWRHGHKALILLRELLLRGPEAILSETLSNIALLRSFLEYKGGVLLGAAVGGGQGPGKIREAARELFFLALDGRALLLHRRVLQAARYRRPAPPPRVRLAMEQVLGSSSFADVHRMLAPAAAPCPTAPDAASAAAGSSAAGVAAVGVPDLLSAAVEESATGGGDEEEGPLLMMEGEALSAFTGAAEPEPKPEAAWAGDGAALIAEEQQQGAAAVGQWETFPQTFKTGQTPPRPIASGSGSGANSPLVQLADPFSAAPQPQLTSGQAVSAYGPGNVPLQGGAAGAAPYDPFAVFENTRS